MTKTQKSEVIDFLTGEFKESQAIVVCDYKGLSHKELETLRNDARENGTKVQVAKNTLVTIAVKNAELGDIELNGTNIFLWSEDQISACKVADKFASANKEKFEIKSGIIEGQIADLATVNAFAKLPSREELLGMLAATWMAPVTNFTIGLDALRKKKEEEAA
ncbi:50S ribosomal protein L10 [Halarcobacter mediterraneus]|uniref:Large ribosomal subunit protein uL10 n=1 Tax=Halarcobacter mediterraneus TaxID=2023153 RepID=A0A4Q1AWC2_9BACT|nr:50S ribosomal protein L10 [Halarcobacter mediterraneus]RXK11778.1 50S ribosomal protein L10 [Halarcobacter mediterraneus]|eukprot:gnl/Chilomastix_cuspidata/7344.p1 GENE.gnl/Chilomastix_cuspidata/7344~~gnl/Chilomastix_cuspidata/7344.p1  ORF type:complete len:163 (+),score=10.62 gnl/Chilomastix_cuspidata/7344:109-597(+)